MNFVDEYCLDMKRRGLSENTIESRRRCLNLMDNDIGLDATRGEIEDYLDSRKLSLKSRATWLSHLNCYYTWCVEEGKTTRHPTARIRPPKVPRKLPRPMKKQDLQLAMEKGNKRMRAWLLLGALAGLRCKEIAGLNREDILVEDMTLRVVETKGGDERMVPLHPRLLEVLTEYGMPDEGPLFRKVNGDRVSAQYVSKLIGEHLIHWKINSTPHSLRHLFGTSVMRSTHDIRTTQELLGHKNIASTAVYTQFDLKTAREAVTGLRLGA